MRNPPSASLSRQAARILSVWLLGGLLFGVVPAIAQPAGAPPPPPQEMHHHATAETAALFSAREASGTAWLPDETPMYGLHRPWRGWQVMLHGSLFVQSLYEPGFIQRTGGFSTHQISSVNWGMLMARRPLGRGRIGVRAMASLEPWTVPGCGYLNLLATGERCEGDTIHDRQHPHDLFMELAAEYDAPLRGAWRWQLYGGLSGEPALGPPGFPHRLSAAANPIAPIAHHWLDATHITFGLATAGVYNRRWKAETSLFNGREPDERRTDVDLGPLDSVSGRLTYAPTRRVTLQVSAAHLNGAEEEFGAAPRSDVNRATASVTYHAAAGTAGIWATTLAYGVNSAREIVPGAEFDAITHAVLLESTWTTRERHTWFGRAEVVEKAAHDLHFHEYATSVFTVGKLQAGYVRHFRAWKGVLPGLGGSIALNLVPEPLTPRYERRVAPGVGLFFTARPVRQQMP